MFIVSLNYVKDLTDIEAHLSDHVAYLDRYYRQGVFLMSGRKQPRTGGIIVMQAESVEQVERAWSRWNVLSPKTLFTAPRWRNIR